MESKPPNSNGPLCAAAFSLCAVLGLLAAILTFPQSFGFSAEAPLSKISQGKGLSLVARWPEGLTKPGKRSFLPRDFPVLEENGVPLRRPRTTKREIENGGMGRYHVAGDKILFSTGDGLSHATRKYVLRSSTFRVPEPLLLLVWALSGVSGIAAGLLCARSLSPIALRKFGFAASLAWGIALTLTFALFPSAVADSFFLGMTFPVFWAIGLALATSPWLGSGGPDGRVSEGCDSKDRGRPARMASQGPSDACPTFYAFRRGVRFGYPLLLTLIPVLATGIFYSLNAASHWFCIAGVVPHSDANLHFVQAAEIAIQGTTTQGFNGRFLYPAYLASVLRLTGCHLQFANLLVAGICLMSLGLVCKWVHQSIGFAGTFLFALVVWLYYRMHGCGLVMTESLGLTFGLLGTAAFLLYPQAHRKIPLILFGIFLFSLGSAARPGALFVLPMLGLFAGGLVFSERKTDCFPRRILWSVGIVAIAGIVVIAGFASNSLLMHFVYSGEVKAFGNFAFSLNGLLSGGDWSESYFRTNGDSVLVMKENIALLTSEPGKLPAGMLRAYRELLSTGFLYQFAKGYNASSTLMVFSGIGLLAVWTVPRLRVMAGWISAAAIGVLLSVPFAPPWDADVRPYAATIPIQALLPALGLCGVLAFVVFGVEKVMVRLLPSNASGKLQEGVSLSTYSFSFRANSSLFLGLSLVVIVLTFLLPILPIGRIAPPAANDPNPVFRSGSYVKISPDPALPPGIVPLSHYLDRLSDLASLEQIQSFSMGHPDQLVIFGIDWRTLRPYALPSRGGQRNLLDNKQGDEK